MAEETEKKIAGLKFLARDDATIIITECYNLGEPSSSPAGKFSICMRYVSQRYKGLKLPIVQSNLAEYENNELEKIINYNEKTTNLQPPS